MTKHYKEGGKKRVLFIVASLMRAGAETQLINLTNSLDKNRFQKFLFTYHHRIDQYKRIDHENIRFYNRPRRRKVDLSVIRSIAAVIDNEKIEVVHCTNLFSLFMGWLSISIANCRPKLIVTMHTTIIKSIKANLIERIFYQWLLKSCDNVIFVCKAQAEHWKAKYPFLVKNSTVIYNGIDVSHFDPRRFKNQGIDLKNRFSIPESSPVICCIAQFRREKSHEDIIEAISFIKEKIFLFLAGEGPRKAYIETLVKEKGLENRVKFMGNVNDVRPLLAASDISVLASTAIETFSLAMLESMSMGVPVIATNIGGLSEAIIPGRTGTLVPINSPAILAKALSKMIDDKKEYAVMQKNCCELVARKFTTERMVSAVEEILLSVNV
jgi:glycosyltransferase involved in cell wall biosynthesis